jgi:hypothetical protein
MKIIDAATASVDATFTESVTNNDGSPVTDLAYSSVYYQVGNGALIVGAKVPASKLTGGGAMSTTLIVPAPVGAVTTINFQASETDTQGNEGLKTAVVTFKIDRLAPAAPTSFGIA